MRVFNVFEGDKILQKRSELHVILQDLTFRLFFCIFSLRNKQSLNVSNMCVIILGVEYGVKSWTINTGKGRWLIRRSEQCKRSTK